jgi:hypothetical protein
VRNHDANFESSAAEALDTREANREVLDSVTRFARSIDLSFRRAAATQC